MEHRTIFYVLFTLTAIYQAGLFGWEVFKCLAPRSTVRNVKWVVWNGLCDVKRRRGDSYDVIEEWKKRRLK